MGIQNCRVNWKNKIENVKNWPLRWKFECERLIHTKGKLFAFFNNTHCVTKKIFKKIKRASPIKTND